MRMRPALLALVGVVLCGVTLSSFAQSSPAPSAPVVTPPPPPAPSKAPLGAPPVLNEAEVNSAYEFRNRMSSDPICQDLARQSDSVYADADKNSDEKQKALEQLRRRASAAGCL